MHSITIGEKSTTKKINDTKSCFFEKTKILINLSQAHEEKREKTQINKIRNERGKKQSVPKKYKKF